MSKENWILVEVDKNHFEVAVGYLTANGNPRIGDNEQCRDRFLKYNCPASIYHYFIIKDPNYPIAAAVVEDRGHGEFYVCEIQSYEKTAGRYLLKSLKLFYPMVWWWADPTMTDSLITYYEKFADEKKHFPNLDNSGWNTAFALYFSPDCKKLSDLL